MHIHYLDPFNSGDSAVHKLDARVKLILAISYIFSIALIPVGTWPIYVLMMALILSVIILSELGIKYVYTRSLIAIPFTLAALPLVFTIPGPDLASFEIGSWSISISQSGLERFISIALKSWLSVQMAIVLTGSTPFPDILMAMRAIYIPRVIVAIFSLMWRYLFVLVDEAVRLNRARASRSGLPAEPHGKTGGSLIWRARVTGGMVGNLFLRALDRSDRIYLAMVSRGYDGEVRALTSPRLNLLDWIVLCVFISVLIMLLLIAFLL